MKQLPLLFLLMFVLGGSFSHVFAQSKLDKQIKAGLDHVKAAEFEASEKEFQQAAKRFKKKSEASAYLFTLAKVPDEDDGQGDEDSRAILSWRHTMATEQAIKQFIAYNCYLGGGADSCDGKIRDVYGLQNVMWGTSWRVFVEVMDDVFRQSMPEGKLPNHSRFMLESGDLLLSAGHEKGLAHMETAFRDDPISGAIGARLASVHIIRLNAAKAKTFAEASLNANPKQGRVLIDLATSEWLLGNLEAARAVALKASSLEPELPGPHATLSLVAIEKGEAELAVKESSKGVELSGDHSFYLLIHAIALETNGDSRSADKFMRKTQNDVLFDEEKLKSWFFRGKPLSVALKIIGRMQD